MNKYMILIVISIVSILYAIEVWENTYGGIYDEIVASIAITDDKNYIAVGGSMDSPIFGGYFYAINVNEYGDSIWARTYVDSIGGACSIIKANDGEFAVSGQLSIDDQPHYVLLKINSSGDSLWIQDYGQSYSYSFSSVIETNDGGFMLVWEEAPTTYHDFYVIRTNCDGDSLWTRTIDYSMTDFGRSIIKANDETFIIVGRTDFPPSEYDVYITKIDSLGEVIWTTVYGGMGTNEAWFIDTTSDGNYIITGKTSLYYSVLFDVYLLKINDDGDTLWTRKIGGEDESDIGRCVRQTTDGGYIITGWTYSYGIGTPDSSNVYLVKTDSEGYVEWERTYGGTGEDKGYSVSQTDDGGYIIAGVYDQGPHYDVYLIKTDSLGNVDWIREPGMKPEEIVLNVYPNPFNDVCRITVDVGAWRAMPLQIEIFDLRGNLLETFDKTSCVWKPDEGIGSGIYLVRAKTVEKTVSKKIMYVR